MARRVSTTPLGETMIAAQRLQLRPYSLADFDDMHALMSRQEVHLYPRREPLTEEESWSRLLRHLGHWREFGFGFLAVEERATGRVIGEAGFSYFRRGLGSQWDLLPEASWTIAPERQGRGFASEAAAAAQQWAEERLGFARTLCMIHDGNLPSLRIAEKLGYQECHRATYNGRPVTLFERRPTL